MRGVEQHLQQALQDIEPLESLAINVSDAIGCVLAEDAVAPVDMPFDGISTGDVVLNSGTTIGPRQMALLAGAGLGSIQVRPRPRVVVISVGSNLVAPGRGLPTIDHAVDAAQDMLAGAVFEAGGVAYHVGPLADDVDLIANTVEDQLVRADLVIIASGGESGPSHALLDALPKVGTVEISEIALSPASWQGLGTLGQDNTPVAVVSNDPTSAYIAFEIFIRPVLRQMLGQDRVLRPVVRAITQAAVVTAPGRQHVALARLGVDDGQYVVTPATGKGLKALGSGADCLIVIPEGTVTVSAGDTVPVLRLDRP